MKTAFDLSPHRQQIHYFQYGGQHKGTHYRPLCCSPLYAGREAASRPCEDLRQNSKVTDHHAILPTAEFAKTGFSSLAESEKKLMTLVCTKLLCAVAAPHKYEAVTAVFTCGGCLICGYVNPRYNWSASCSSYCSLGTRRKEHRTGCPVFLSKLIVIGTISFAN